MLEEDGIWLKRDAIASVYSTAYVARLGRQCAAYRGCTTPLHLQVWFTYPHVCLSAVLGQTRS